jgi:hypothetical protein
MTDARLPARWLLDPAYNGLSDGAWRTFTRLLMWTVDARTDGVIRLDQLDLIPRARPEHVPELVEHGIAKNGGGLLTLTCFASTQTSREQLEAAEAAREAERAADRERKRRKRVEAQAAETSDRKSDRNPDPETQAGRKARTGQEGQAVTEPDSDSWPSVRPIPDADALTEQERNRRARCCAGTACIGWPGRTARPGS